MDLEEMKAAWSTMDDELKQQKKLTNQMITDMIQLESQRKLSRIAIAEGLGIAMAIVMLIYLLLNFDKLNNWLTFSSGIVLVFVLIVAIVMGVRIIQKSQKIDLSTNTYVETLAHYDDLRDLLRTYKKVSIGIYAIIPLCLLPVFLAIFKDIDVLTNQGMYFKTIAASYLVLPVVLWLFIKFYKNILTGLKKLIDRKTA